MSVLDRPRHDVAGCDNPDLLNLVAAIRAAYGPRIERIVLFGSRARGDAQADSDYDIAVFIHGMGERMKDRLDEVGRLRDIEASACKTNGPLFETVPFTAGAWKERTLFMLDLRAEGIDL